MSGTRGVVQREAKEARRGKQLKHREAMINA